MINAGSGRKLRQSQKAKDATPIKEEAIEEEFSDNNEDDQFSKQQQKFTKQEGVRRQTTKGDFERDTDGDRDIKNQLDQIASEHSNSKSYKIDDSGNNFDGSKRIIISA